MQLDRINRQTLASLYKISASCLYQYLKPHEKALRKISTTRERKDGRVIYSKFFNKVQLAFIVETIMKDTPPGYDFINGRFIEIEN